MEIDFTEDRRQWHEVMTEHERRAALWNYAMFFHGEDAVADDLAPFIDAAPREEQKYFLATQQVDEARHAIFFKRFMHEVVGRGDGTIAGGAARHRAASSPGASARRSRCWTRSPARCARDRSRVALARAVTMYHIVVEALLAQPGQHFISDYLEQRDLLPGFRAGMRQRRARRAAPHRLRRQAAARPRTPRTRRCRDAVADLIREVTPYSLAVFIPPGWDRSYTECFGFTLEEIYTEGARSFEAKLRSAGLPLESLPGPSVFPLEMPRAPSAPSTGWRCCAPASSARPTARRRATRRRWSCCSRRSRRAVDHRTAPAGPFTVQWEFAGRRAVARARRQRRRPRRRAGRAPQVDLELRCRYEDWVDIVAGRLDPRRALATGKLRPHGSPRALWARPRAVLSPTGSVETLRTPASSFTTPGCEIDGRVARVSSSPPWRGKS